MNREAIRLEKLWGGTFGDAYTLRNDPDKRRSVFWTALLRRAKPANVLEVGCNRGGNLRCIAGKLDPRRVYGVDINESALAEMKKKLPGVNSLWAAARELPFRDGFFDLVFTAGVLIHQPEESLGRVMSEAVRVSGRWVLCLEYFSSKAREIFYRGHQGALFKRDYGRLYRERHPELSLKKSGFLGKDQGWDDVTYWLFEKGKREEVRGKRKR